MNRQIILIVTICCFFSVIAVAQKPQTRQKPADQSGAIDPRAMAALNRMNDYLKTLKTFRINTEVSKDELVDTNMKIQKRCVPQYHCTGSQKQFPCITVVVLQYMRYWG